MCWAKYKKISSPLASISLTSLPPIAGVSPRSPPRRAASIPPRPGGSAKKKLCKNFNFFSASPRKILPQLLRLASVSLPRESARGWRQGPGVGRELCSIFEVDINYGFCIVLHANFEY